MHKLHELKEKLMKELEDYAGNGKFSKDDVEVIKYTASAIDHICNIMEDAEGEEYSGMPYHMPYGGSYARGRGTRSMRRGANQYGSYGYSRASEDIAGQLRDVMADVHDDRIRTEIEHLVNKVERM